MYLYIFIFDICIKFSKLKSKLIFKTSKSIESVIRSSVTENHNTLNKICKE